MRSLFTSIPLTLFVFSIATETASARICPSINGWWKIAANITPANSVSALPAEEIKGLIGERAFISDRYKTFGPYRCHVTSNENGFMPDEELRKFHEIRAYPFFIFPECEEYKLNTNGVPGFQVGKNCNVIVAVEDGVTFELHRIHRRRPHH